VGFNGLLLQTNRIANMSNKTGFDFTQFVPGFDFLKNLGTAGNTGAATGWVAPTLDPEELDKRIQELKTVQFWLDQNAKAIGATIQALEVQRMTLSTLKSMNMNFQDMVDAAQPSAETTQAKPAGIDPAQWWNALTQQFQDIASQAVQDMGQQAQAHAAPRSASAKASAQKPPSKTAKKPAVKRKSPRSSAP